MRRLRLFRIDLTAGDGSETYGPKGGDQSFLPLSKVYSLERAAASPCPEASRYHVRRATTARPADQASRALMPKDSVVKAYR